MPNTPSLAVVMDPIAKIKCAKDSTLAMLIAAAARGWKLMYFEQPDLFLRDGVALECAQPRRRMWEPRVQTIVELLACHDFRQHEGRDRRRGVIVKRASELPGGAAWGLHADRRPRQGQHRHQGQPGRH